MAGGGSSAAMDPCLDAANLARAALRALATAGSASSVVGLSYAGAGSVLDDVVLGTVGVDDPDDGCDDVGLASAGLAAAAAATGWK